MRVNATFEARSRLLPRCRRRVRLARFYSRENHAVPLSIDDAIVQVRKLIAEGDRERTNALVEAVEAVQTPTMTDLRGLVAFLFEAQRHGMAEVVVERFANTAPADIDAQLFRVETFIKMGRSVPAVTLMESMRPLSHDDCVRVGRIWTQLGYNVKAATAYKTAVGLVPDDISCRRALVEAYTWARQTAPARRALADLVPRLPDQAHWWAFAADQASLLGDDKLFRLAASRAEPILGADGYSRLLLARANGRCRQTTEMKRLLAGLDIAALRSDSVLKMLLDLAEEHQLADFQLAAATEVTVRGTAPPALFEKSSMIVASQRQFAR
jgi:hypothetical protein